MTATERVSTNKTVIGAKKVSGLFFKGCVTRVITVTTKTIYAEAPRAFKIGFLVISKHTKFSTKWNALRTTFP